MSSQEIELTDCDTGEPNPGTSTSGAIVSACSTFEYPQEMELVPVPDLEEVSSSFSNRKKSTSKPLPTFPVIGVTFTTLYVVFSCLLILFIKLLLMRNYSPIALSVWKQLGSLLPSLYFLVRVLKYDEDENNPMRKPLKFYMWKHVYPIREHWKNCMAVCIAALFSATGTIFRIYSYSYLSITNAVAANYTFMVFLFVMSWIFLKAKTPVVNVVAGMLILSGVFILTKPLEFLNVSYDTDLIVGLGLKVADTFAAAAFTVIARKIHFVHFIIINCSCGIIGISLGLIGSAATGSFKLSANIDDAGLLLLIAIGTTMTHALFSMAVRYEQHGLITCCRTIDMLFASVLQVVFLEIWPDIWTASGSAVIAVAVILVGVRQCLQELPQHSSVRTKCNLLLQ